MKDNVKVIGELGRLCGQPLIKIETDMKRLESVHFNILLFKDYRND